MRKIFLIIVCLMVLLIPSIQIQRSKASVQPVKIAKPFVNVVTLVDDLPTGRILSVESDTSSSFVTEDGTFTATTGTLVFLSATDVRYSATTTSGDKIKAAFNPTTQTGNALLRITGSFPIKLYGISDTL